MKEIEKYRLSLREIAKAEGLPLTGITILGGRPYVNVSGLDAKMREKAQKENLVISRISVEPIGEEIPEGPGSEVERRTFGYRGVVEFFDREGFLKALSKFENPTEEVLKTLREMFSYRFEDEGWSSALTCEAIAYKYEPVEEGKAGVPVKKRKAGVLVENVRMMAARKATNRAKRLAVGCGLTSVEEVGVPSEEVPAEEVPSEEVPSEIEEILEEIQNLSSPVEARDWGEKNKPRVQALSPEDRARVKDAWLIRMGEFTDSLLFSLQRVSSAEELEKWKEENDEAIKALPEEDRKVVEREVRKKESLLEKEKKPEGLLV